MIRLLIKTHNITGHKYFCKTIKENPYTYKGSGVEWKKHIKKYGYDVTTEIYYETENECDELYNKAVEFSKENNIVESDKWANQVPETGCSFASGLPIGYKHTDSTLEKMRESALKRNPMSDKTKEKISNAHKGKQLSQEHKDKIKKRINELDYKTTDEMKKYLSDIQKGKKLTEDHLENLRAAHSKRKGIKTGPMSDEHKKNLSESKKKKFVKTEVQCPHCKLVGYISPMKRYHFDNCKENPNIDPAILDNRKHKKKREYKTKECPHCGLIGKGSQMTVHHFDNCKEKK